MPRHRTLTCADCAKPMWTGNGTLPQGEARCRDCRRLLWPLCPCGCGTRLSSQRPKYCSLAAFRAASRKPKELTACVVCGVEFEKRRQHRDANLCCSRDCGFEYRRIVHNSRPVEPLAPASRVFISQCESCAAWGSHRRPSRYCPTGTDCYRARRTAKDRANRPPRETIRECRLCGDLFESYRAMKYCSITCARTAAGRGHRARARKFGVEYEPINPVEIFERDGWRCHLCKKLVKRKRAYDADPSGASLDHIIPMSLGGPHLRTNVACAHFGCNSAKGASGVGDQLLLVG